ncbi:hypothetical protein IQ270_13590 [Microcoleus sp. LEGE 07076]|uniref:hypothetical protein n=1 Tax=Microcoleus sp. LEGE 07076 TaxID=915322 RepID=UPI00187F391A|nr:hypothetical protein [Microcoleus sp. LEGE 07076]MBE9185702.1 hypothetical protein [Microcoleus sp. LEGE 07076]
MKIKSFSTTIALALLSSIIYLPEIARASPKPPIQIAQQRVFGSEIESFTSYPVQRLEPGTELFFVLRGAPYSRATLTIPNAVQNLPMREVQPGVYEASYVIRNGDRISENTAVRANLQQGDRISSTRLQQPLVAANSDRRFQSLSVDRFSAQPVQQLEPGTTLNFKLLGTPNSTATFSIEGVAYNIPMREESNGLYTGEYTIRRQDYFPPEGAMVTASLQSGNQVIRSRLDRELIASDNGSSNTAEIPLEILTPKENARVSGTVEVEGRSAPNATVNVKVQATSSVAGLFGFERNILERTIKADEQGKFSFAFKPSISLPGTRYDVNLSASRGDRTSEETLVLFQN